MTKVHEKIRKIGKLEEKFTFSKPSFYISLENSKFLGLFCHFHILMNFILFKWELIKNTIKFGSTLIFDIPKKTSIKTLNFEGFFSLNWEVERFKIFGQISDKSGHTEFEFLALYWRVAKILNFETKQGCIARIFFQMG